MDLIKKFCTTISIQSIGSISLFLVIWLIGRTLGPGEQGQFSAMKSFVDLSVTVLLFGLPQSFIYGIHRLGIQRGRLMRWALKYGAVSFALLLFAFMFVWHTAWNSIIPANGPSANVGLLAAAIAGLVIHGFLRCIFLTLSDGWQFSLITIQPALILCVASSVLIGIHRFNSVMAYAIVGIFSAIASIRMTRKCLLESSSNQLLPWKELLANGGTVFVQSTVMATQPFLTLSLLRHYSGGYQDVAFFSLAMYAYQAAAVPLTMTAPMLFNRWSNTDSTNMIAGDLRNMSWPLLFIVVVVTIAWFIIPDMVAFIFGQAYLNAIPAIQMMLVGIPFMYIAYVGMPALMSVGEFRVNAAMVIVRLLVCFAAFIFFLLNDIGGDRPRQAAQSWVLAEVVMAAMVVFMLVKKFYRAPEGIENV